MIQARCLRGLSNNECRGAHLKLEWEDIEIESRRAKLIQNADARICEPSSQRLVEFLVTDEKLPHEKVSEISGLSQEIIAKVLKKRSSFTCRWNQGFSGIIRDPKP